MVPSVVHRCGSDELFVGRAGYLSGALWLNSELKSDIVPQTDLFLICNSIVQSGREYVRRKGSRKQVSNYIFRLFPIISISQRFFSIFFLTLEKIGIDEKVMCYHNISN